MDIDCSVLVRAKSAQLDSSVELLTSIHIRQPRNIFYVQRDFMIETNRRTLQNARGERYGWNPHISSIARTPYSFWKREDTRDVALVADASSTALVWIYLFVIGDRPEQRRWAVVAGDDLALRGNSCAPAADRQGHVLGRSERAQTSIIPRSGIQRQM